ncbi:branched-chain amino acid ABC transporter permease [Pseudonocardia sp. GCM10023141]|uniref:branched-chain amino acid ABC transporter permease n=1 Tax=Pseudonocardia sp. GCM10023141 TaxID=3252653 RepID=UPI0036144D33
MGQVIVSGLQLGSSYALMALALVLVLKATAVPNFAMAEMGLLPAFLVWVAVGPLHWNLYVAVGCGLAVAFVLGIVVERGFIRPIVRHSHLSATFMTIGLFFLVNSIVALVWGSDPRPLEAPVTGSFALGGTVVPYEAIVTIVVAAAIMIGLEIFFRSPAGVQMRAIAEDRVTPRLLGVKLPRMFRIAWGMATVVSTIAVVLTAQSTVLNDQTSQTLILTGFVAATLGGFSSVGGAFVGGLALGVVENLVGNYVSTASASAVSLLVVVAVLMIKPEGLFGRGGVREI